MQIFHWDRVETVKNYATGDAVIMARNINAARVVFRENLMAWLKEHRSWYFDATGEFDSATLDSDEVEEILAKIEADVSRDPIIMNGPCGVIIRGSE